MEELPRRRIWIDAPKIRFEMAMRALRWPVAGLVLCIGLNSAQARPALSGGPNAVPQTAVTIQIAAENKKEVPKAGRQTKVKSPKADTKPRCIDVGGYEAYMRRTGKVCMVGLESYQGPEYRGGR